MIFSLACPSDGTETLLDWESVHHKLPWNVVLLLGSGFALADGAEVCTVDKAGEGRGREGGLKGGPLWSECKRNLLQLHLNSDQMASLNVQGSLYIYIYICYALYIIF